MPRESLKKQILPIALLSEGGTALVVGAGNVGVHKINLLLSSGMHVKVVSPSVSNEISSISDRGLEFIRREFVESDLNGIDVVFAATNDTNCNLNVLELCNQKSIKCCVVDQNWPKGDFITPAVFSSGDITISISTGGLSCSMAKDVKQFLKNQLDDYLTQRLSDEPV